jgi:hypothetical protein
MQIHEKKGLLISWGRLLSKMKNLLLKLLKRRDWLMHVVMQRRLPRRLTHYDVINSRVVVIDII